VKRVRFLASALALSAFPRIASARPLEEVLREEADAIPGISGVFACTMADETPLFAYNAGISFPSASVIKLVIMLAAFVNEDASPGTLARRIVTRRADLIGGSLFLANQPDGASFSVLELITPMIQLSDNTAANTLMSHFGIPEINRVGNAAGLTGTHLGRHFLDYAAIVKHHDNVTIPSDMAHLLFQIERGAREGIPTIASTESCGRMVRVLLGQTDREGIPAGVPGVPVANKTGAVDYTRNDAAIVDPFGDSPFVLTIFTKELRSYAGAYDGMQRIARTLHQHLLRSGL
jgi:beta-lactamase class A